jgi:V/A-type H+-transporting ATPase subunit A
LRTLLQHGNEVQQMMTVVGEEGTSLEDFTVSLKADFFDSCYLQQNAFDEVDAATPAERQQFVFSKVLEVINANFSFTDKAEARRQMFEVTDLFRNWNYAPVNSDEYRQWLDKIDQFLAQASAPAGI